MPKSVNSSDSSDKKQPTMTKALNMSTETKIIQITKLTSHISTSQGTNDDIKLILQKLNEMKHDNQKTNQKIDDITDTTKHSRKRLIILKV